MVGTAGFEYRARYHLTENDARFLDLTDEQILADNWAWRIRARPNLGMDGAFLDDPEVEDRIDQLMNGPLRDAPADPPAAEPEPTPEPGSIPVPEGLPDDMEDVP